ncbi:MAG: hypothetical protein AAF443_03205 [Chlamydiota bacterium]
MNIPQGIYRIVSKKDSISYQVRIRIKGHPHISKTLEAPAQKSLSSEIRAFVLENYFL